MSDRIFSAPPLPADGAPLLFVSPPCRDFSPARPGAACETDRAPGLVACGAPAPPAAGGDTARAAMHHVYLVQLQTGHGGKARAFGVVFECGLATVASIRSQMLRGGIVSGNKLLLEDCGDGGLKIVGRVEFAFGAYGLVSVEPYQRRLVEAAA